MPRATVQSIADELRLSKFAVSRALSGKPGVSAQTRRLVTEAAERQGYRPRASRRQGDARLTVLARDSATASRELWMDVRNGIEIQAMREGYEVDFVHCEDPEEISLMAEWSLGFILLGPNRDEAMVAAQATGRPVVACCHLVPPLLRIDQVTGTDVESGSVVGEYLVGLGHRDIVYVQGQSGFPGRVARLHGLRAVVGDDVRIGEITFSDDYASAELAPALRRLIEAGLSPTAFFCGSDGVAVTTQSELMRLGIRVPGDVSVVGHADYPLAIQVSPRLTTIHMPHREIGLQAVAMIKRRLTQEMRPLHKLNMRVQLVASLVERESSGPPGRPAWERCFAINEAVSR